MGDSITHAVPVYEGFTLSHAVSKLDLAGRDVTQRLLALLAEADPQRPPQGTRERLEAARLKEERCYVALDYEEEVRREDATRKATAAQAEDQATPGRAYTLPDGKVDPPTQPGTLT